MRQVRVPLRASGADAMSNLFSDYTKFLCEAGPSALALEESLVLVHISGEFAKVFNAWLEKCVMEWCPQALHCHQIGDLQGAVDVLNRFNFCYACLPDHVYEFRQGDTTLARCKMEWTITAKCDSPKP